MEEKKLNISENINKESEITKNQIIITIILGILIGYAGLYILYYIFIEEPFVIEAKDVLEEKKAGPTLYAEAEELVSHIPYLLNDNTVYNETEKSSVDKLNNDFVVNFMINNIPEEDKEINADCKGNKTCYTISLEKLNELSKEYYNKKFEYTNEVPLLNGTCILENNIYNCEEQIDTSQSGKLSGIEFVKENEEELIVYEKVLFVDSLKFSSDNLVAEFKTISILPDLKNSLTPLGQLNVINGKKEEVLSYFSKSALIYKHTFKKVDGRYIWSNTENVDSVEQ